MRRSSGGARDGSLRDVAPRIANRSWGRPCRCGLFEVSHEAGGLALVRDHCEEAKSAAALRAGEHIDVMASPQQGRPLCAGALHEEQSVKQSLHVGVAQNER